MDIRCTNCGEEYPGAGLAYRCASCGGAYDYIDPAEYDPNQVDNTKPGIWKYRHTFSEFDGVEALSLGEGGTPLMWAEVPGRRIAFKCEYANPTGSFKDRGTATLLAFLRSRGVTRAIEDSSGNAGASFAAYAARAGIQARVFVPKSASGAKREQIEMCGAALVQVVGPRAAASEAAARAAREGEVYASHAWLPFSLAGYATAAYEIAEQIADEIGAVVVPAGQGGLLLGMTRGFEALVRAGVISHVPVMIGVQAQVCAPLVALAAGDHASITEADSIAEGVRVFDPVRKAEVVRAAHASGGGFVSVPEADILPARDELAQRGFYVEPTSALVWPALLDQLPGLPDPVVAVLTGSGYKVRL